MTDKTPEDLASDYAVKFMAESNLHFDTPVTAHRQSWIAGYEAGRPKWVSVKEQLPRMYKDVLCFCHNYYAVGCCVPNGVWTDPEEMELNEDRFKEIVKEWQELPPTKED